MKSQLTSDYRFLIAIEPKQKREDNEKEVWKAVQPYKIPKGKYQFVEMIPQQENLKFVLSDGNHKIQLYFHEVLAMRMFDKNVVTSSIYQENALYQQRKEEYLDVVYQVSHGEFQFFLNEKSRNIRNVSVKYFVILCASQVVEVASISEPEIIIIK